MIIISRRKQQSIGGKKVSVIHDLLKFYALDIFTLGRRYDIQDIQIDDLLMDVIPAGWWFGIPHLCHKTNELTSHIFMKAHQQHIQLTWPDKPGKLMTKMSRQRTTKISKKIILAYHFEH